MSSCIICGNTISMDKRGWQKAILHWGRLDCCMASAVHHGFGSGKPGTFMVFEYRTSEDLDGIRDAFQDDLKSEDPTAWFQRLMSE